jgi:hypothetical protein
VLAEREAPGATECTPAQRALLYSIRQGLIIVVRAIEAYLGIQPPRSER